MKITFIWEDLRNDVDDASADDINKIAHAITDIVTKLNSEKENDVDLSDYYTKDYIDNIVNVVSQNIKNLNDDIKFKEDAKKNKILSDEDSTYEDAKYYSANAVENRLNEIKLDINAILTNNYVDYQALESILNDRLGNIESATASIIALQNQYIGGESA